MIVSWLMLRPKVWVWLSSRIVISCCRIHAISSKETRISYQEQLTSFDPDVTSYLDIVTARGCQKRSDGKNAKKDKKIMKTNFKAAHEACAIQECSNAYICDWCQLFYKCSMLALDVKSVRYKGYLQRLSLFSSKFNLCFGICLCRSCIFVNLFRF